MKSTWLSAQDHCHEAKHCYHATITVMLPNLDLSSLLSPSSFVSVHFVIYILYYFFCVWKSSRSFFQLRFSRGSKHGREIFQKCLLVFFFIRSSEPNIPVEKFQTFLLPTTWIGFLDFMEHIKVVAWLISLFLWNWVLVVDGTDNLLSPKGVNYEGLVFLPFACFSSF